MIDLHGRSVKETKKILEEHFTQIKEKNTTELYIITGRGNHIAPNGNRGVLKKVLPKLLKPYCDEITQIDPEVGSYKIILKQPDQNAIDCFKKMAIFVLGTSDENEQIKYIQDLERKAQKNDIDALLAIASCHLVGYIKGIDNKLKAVELVNKAKVLGSLEAYVLLGMLYMEGIAVRKDYSEALKLFRYAASKDHALGQLCLAKCYALGQGIKQNDQQTLAWLEKSASLGNADAQFNLGYSYFNGQYTKQNDALAFKYLTQAVLQHHPQAKSYLARCYACGYGVTQNYKEAFSLYLQVANYDDVYAIYQVGLYYSDGRAGNINYEAAFDYFMRGAKLQDIDCQVEVGHAYLYGVGVEHDSLQGIQWLEKGVAKKKRAAYYYMAYAYANGLGVEKNPQQEQRFLELAAEKDHAAAQLDLGLELLVGKKMPQNFELGMVWIQKAAQNKYVQAMLWLEQLAKENSAPNEKKLKLTSEKLIDAQFHLGLRLLEDEKIPENHTTGMFWIQKAAQNNHSSAVYILEQLTQKKSPDANKPKLGTQEIYAGSFVASETKEKLREAVNNIIPNKDWRVSSDSKIWLQLLSEEEAQKIVSHFKQNDYNAIELSYRKDAPNTPIIILKNPDYSKLMKISPLPVSLQKNHELKR